MATSILDVLICVHNRNIPIKKHARTIDIHNIKDVPYKHLCSEIPDLTAMQLRDEIANSEPGKITFPKNGINGSTAIGWVTGRGSRLRSLEGKLKKRTEAYCTQPLTKDQLENRFIEQLKVISDYWGTEEKLNPRQAVEGTIHSVLELLHAGDKDPTQPRYRLVALSNSDNNQHLIEEGLQPYPNTDHLLEDSNLLFNAGSPANNYLVKVRGYGEPLGYGV